MSSLTCGVWLFCILAQPNLGRTPEVPFEVRHTIIVRQAPAPAPAQPATKKASTPRRDIFVSWGYNGDSYSKSDLHISQPSLGNDFTLAGVQARDSKAWTELFSHSLFVPQYNVRAGMFFNERWGLEVALDHMKWIVRQDQAVAMTGTLNGAPVDTRVTLTPDVLRYQLNNGANPIFFNVIRRVRFRGEPGRTGSVFFLPKAGAGFAVPHTENTLFGEPNEKGFQFFHGWNIDAAAALRVHILKRLYVEVEEKALFVRYFGVNVDQGTAHHSVKAAEFSFHFGVSFR